MGSEETKEVVLIKKSPKADTRTSDYTTVSKEELIESTLMHISDVFDMTELLVEKLFLSVINHDKDKLIKIDNFYKDFVTGFKEHTWWDNHKKINRHHLNSVDGIRDDVNLLDVIEYLIDCSVAGMARKGEITPIDIDPEVLMKAFKNTADLIKSKIVLID